MVTNANTLGLKFSLYIPNKPLLVTSEMQPIQEGVGSGETSGDKVLLEMIPTCDLNLVPRIFPQQVTGRVNHVHETMKTRN